MYAKEFFAQLSERGPAVLPRKLRGTIRFDLERGLETDHWFVAMTDEGVLVSHDEREALCVARTEEALFDRLVAGEAHMVAALIRNEMTVEGNLPLLLLFRRLFPQSVGSRDPRDWHRAEGSDG